MSEIIESTVQDALARLRLIKETRLSDCKLSAAGWEEVNSLLRRLESALGADDRADFSEALRTLVSMLAPPTVRWRGTIGPPPRGDKRPPPAPVWEAFNHIVERLERPDTTHASEPQASADSSSATPPKNRDGNL